MKNNNDTPEKWALDEAVNRKESYIVELARMIQQYEPHLKPLDPDEAIAAEACAQVCNEAGWDNAASEYRSGLLRESEVQKSALRAIKLYKESVS